MTILRDTTGMPCINCILNDTNHSNRSRLSDSVNSKTRAWRICKDCLKKNKARTRDRHNSRAYSKKYMIEKWQYILANQCKRRARDTGVKNEISADTIIKMYRKQEGKCFWLGIKVKPSINAKALDQPSIDRLDAKGDYTAENCVLCCYFANWTA